MIDRDVENLLKETGAVLKRHGKHPIYEFPNGETLTISATPSDVHAPNQQIRDIRRIAGLVKEPRKVAVKREKPGRYEEPVKQLRADLRAANVERQKYRLELRSANSAIAEILQESAAQKARIERLTGDLSLKQRSLDDLKTRRRACWMCRWRDRWRSWRAK